MCAMAENIEQLLMMRYVATSLPPLLTDTVHWLPAHAPWLMIFLSVIFSSMPAHFWLVVASPHSAILSVDIQVHDLFLISTTFWLCPLQKRLYLAFPAPPALAYIPSILRYVTAACFWLVVVWLQTEAAKSHNVIIFNYPYNLLAKIMGKVSPPRFRPPSTASAIESPYHIRQLSVDFCVASLNGGHLRPHLSLYVLMGLGFVPQTREPTTTMAPPILMARALHGPIGSGSAMSCWRRCHTHWESKRQSNWSVGREFLCCCCVLLCCVVGLGAKIVMLVLRGNGKIWKLRRHNAFICRS